MSEQDSATHLNLAGKLAKGFLTSKITILIMLVVTLFGTLAVIVTPRLYNPEIVVPAASILVMRLGNSPQEIENQVVQPLEEMMAGIKGVKHTFGYATNDMGVVTVEFKVGSNEEKSLLLLYNQLIRNMDRLPPGTMQPLVKSIGINDVPIMGITLSSDRLNQIQLRELGVRMLEQLHTVPDVGNSEVIGGQRKAVVIDIKPLRLADTGLSLEQVINLLRAANVIVPAGNLVHDNHQYPLRVNVAFASLGQLGDLIIGEANHKPVFLKDVATIKMGPLHENRYVGLGYGAATHGVKTGNPEPAVTLAIGKRNGANAVSVAQGVLIKLHQLKREMLPQGVQVTITRDYGSRANDAVNTLIEHLATAIAVVSVILLFFLGWRESLIVALTVPLTLFVVLGVGWMIGQTINRISLFALILSLGLMVDAAIVVIENIHRHMHYARGKSHFGQLLVNATNEIGNPTNIATLAVILAFIPMAFVTGMMGPFMRPIPINVSIAMIASLIMAYIVVPWVANLWLKSKHARMIGEQTPTLEELDEQPRDFLNRSYIAVFKPLLESSRKRAAFFLVVIVLLVLSMLMPLWQFIRPSGMNGPLSPRGVSLQMLPSGNVNRFMIEVDMPAGTALDETNRVAQVVARVISRNRYVRNYEIYLGRTEPLTFAGMVRGDDLRRGTNIAQIVVNIINRHERPHTLVVATEVWNALKSVRKEFPRTHIKLYPTPPGPPVMSQVVARLSGPNYQTLRRIAGYVEANFRKMYGMINVDDSVTATAPEYIIHVDARKAMLSGVAPARVAQLVHDYVAGARIGSMYTPKAPEPVDIIVRLKRADRAWIQQILNLTITNKVGKQVPLAGIIQIQPSSIAKPMDDRDQFPVVYVTGDVLNFSPVYATLSLDKLLDNATLPNGIHLTTGNLGFFPVQPNNLTHYQVLWGGDMRLTLNVFRDLGTAFIVALILIYLLLVAYYQSFMLPVIVMGAIPLTLIGIFPGHWLFHMPFNATSMIGFIALAGIVVRNSLLMIDFMLDYRKQGYSLEQSVIEAGAVRFRPILLTALAIMFGSVVMIGDPVFGGLAISLIFGTFASTMLTLVVIPLLYYLWQRYELRRHPEVV